MSSIESKIQSDYHNRINKVFEYIDDHLTSKLTLELIAEVAHFSPFHFHRVFKQITDETLNEYITRRRIEKSALNLIHNSDSITETYLKYGFNDNSSFTRTFKKFYGISPSEFKRQNPNKYSKISQLDSNNGQLISDREKYICAINNLKNWINMNAQIEVKEMAAIEAAAVTHIGIFDVEKAFDKLLMWANSKHLLEDPEAKVGRVFYDSVKVTAPDKVRMSVFLSTSTPFEVEGEINKLSLARTKCVVGRYEITPMDFEKSWTGLFVWMNENGYQKSTENPFEIYHNDYRKHPENKFVVDLCIPIE